MKMRLVCPATINLLAVTLLAVVVVLPKPSMAFVESWLSSSDLRNEALQKLVVKKKPTTNKNKHDKNKEDTIKAKVSVAPVSIHPGQDTNIIFDGDHDDEKEPPALSLGEPISFETPLFKGKILIRLKNAMESDSDPQRHDQYFTGREKRLMQTVVQGRFKKSIKMSDIYVGTVLQQPLAKKPPSFVVKVLEKAFRAVQPGAIVDITSSNPKIIALYSGSAQAVSRHHPTLDDEADLPDILMSDNRIDEIEYLPHLQDELKGCSQRRMKLLSHPKHASRYEYDTDHIYTFHIYNEVLDFGLGTVEVPLLGPHDLKPLVGSQPFQMSACSSEGETLYHFEIRHTYDQDQDQQQEERLLP